jgi:leucyl aminopeptidase
MVSRLRIGFASIAAPTGGPLVVFAGDGLRMGAATQALLKPTGDLVARAASADGFKGKSGAALDIVAPAGLKASRLVVVGAGKGSEPNDLVKLGGAAMGRIPAAAAEATIVLDLPAGPMKPEQAADMALGIELRAYAFDRYKTKRKEGEERPPQRRLTLGVANVQGARKAWGERAAVAAGALIARDLVNEPSNVLYPEEFARRAGALRKLGVAVEVLDERAMKKLGMNALLGVGQGSQRDSRLVVMCWNGGKKDAPPVAFVGKGVCFDTGGISIKQAANMEDMKGDMAGAACVVGLMHALAARKAAVNAVGAIGLVENMPDGKAQRPGDIVTSMSGQTIEIINTDAEGRLVLADVLWYVKSRFKPKFMIDLATLTGAILVALGQEMAALFCNDNKLASLILKSSQETKELVWQMPLHDLYDRNIESRIADMRNVGGRWGGGINAAKMLQRFVGDTKWAHLDICGVAFGVKDTEICKSWGTGWGVRLLDRFVSLLE